MMPPNPTTGMAGRQALSGSVGLASRANSQIATACESEALPRARHLLGRPAMRTVLSLLALVFVLVLVGCGEGNVVTITPESSGCNGSGIESVFAFALILVPLFRGLATSDEDAQ